MAVPSARQLNRTLLDRQLLTRRDWRTAGDVVDHLVGLQAQNTLAPYLGLAARLERFDPREVSAALQGRALVRLTTLRSTLHLHTAADALSLRRWTQPSSERELTSSTIVKPALTVDRDAFLKVLLDLVMDQAVPLPRMGEQLAEAFPRIEPQPLAHLARITAPLAQLPPRGCWAQHGGIVYQHVSGWLGSPMRTPDPAEVVRRYLRAYGPARAADVTAWSGVPGAHRLLATMPDLVRYADERGRALVDLEGLPLAEGDEPVPVRLLGKYDNVFLSHADRDRVTTPERRRAWTGLGSRNLNTILVDGYLEGFWSTTPDGLPDRVELLRRLSRHEQAELDTELDRLGTVLAP